ncbi:MAG: division/cell wall cluster transcriptional repressor MraZ [Anaerolineales bacterium]|jgi:MraZ protein|nr:division/cell wall cluster transcriptional repressor MraZ [Anaerolineales bacterium]
MFLGRDLNKLDDKYRLTIPARYRDELGQGAYILQGFERNLWVLTPARFDALAQKVNHASITEGDLRRLKRIFFSTAEKVELDKSGRILIPEFLRKHAGLQSEVWLIGSGAYFEIWSAAEWEQQDQSLQDVEANSNRFSGIDLSIDI